MAYNLVTTLALESLRAPLDPFPVNFEERFLHDLRAKFRTFYLQYNLKERAVVLPSMFVDDFGDEIPRFATLVDAHNNQFEVLVEKINNNVYFTRGWAALRHIYDFRFGGWLVVVYAGHGHFGITLYDRLQREIDPPAFFPPMKLALHKVDVPSHFVGDLPDSVDLLGYAHDPDYFHVEYEKTLTYHDVSSGSLVLPYHGFGQLAFDQATTSIKLVDDCGNVWQCTLVYVSFPWKHFKVGGEWSRFVAARKLTIGKEITLGVETMDQNEILYITVDN